MSLISGESARDRAPAARHLLAVGRLRADVLWGVRHAFWYAGWFGLLGAVAWLVDSRALTRYGFTLLRVAAYYLLLAVVIGAALGVLRPLGRTRAGAAFMGWVAFGALVLVASVVGGLPLDRSTFLMAAGFGLFGVPAGLHTWGRFGAGASPPAV